MARRPHVPVPVEEGLDKAPRAFTYMGVAYRVRVIGRWHLRALALAICWLHEPAAQGSLPAAGPT